MTITLSTGRLMTIHSSVAFKYHTHKYYICVKIADTSIVLVPGLLLGVLCLC